MPERVADLCAEWRRLLAKASPGPWSATHDIKRGVKVWDAEGEVLYQGTPSLAHCRVSETDHEPRWRHDNALVLWMRNHAEELIAALESRSAAEREP